MDHTPLHETKIHGSITFPCSIYQGKIPKWIPSFPLHWHDDFELIYCTMGQIQVTVWGQVYQPCAKDLMVILPRAVHSIEQCGMESGEYFNIIFHPSLFYGAENDLCYDKYVLPFLNGEKTIDGFHPADSSFNRSVTPCIQSMLSHRRDSYSTHELMIKSGLFLFLHYMNQYSTAAKNDNGSMQLSYSRLRDALFYVQKFYDHDVTIKEAAKRCGFSESYFMKLFKELTGQSFNVYLVNYRLELAAKQLAETKLKVIDIAENCGFHNQSYFTRAFRKKYKQTPLAYRNTIRMDQQNKADADS